MDQPLFVNTVDVTKLSRLHDEVATSVSQLADLAPETLSAQTAYGPIASGFTSALGQALPSRDGSLRAASASGRTIGDLLREAARRFDEGDEQGAKTLVAAAEALSGSDGDGARGPGESSGGAGGATGAGTGGGGAEMAGQVGQMVGQQVGQLAQGIAQSVQGLAQGLTQLPQQIMQGVQGIAQSAEAKAADAKTTDTEADAESGGDDPDDEGARDARADEERDEEHREPAGRDGAQPGRTTEGARAPEPPPVATPAPPAQTRPQQFTI